MTFEEVLTQALAGRAATLSYAGRLRPHMPLYIRASTRTPHAATSQNTLMAPLAVVSMPSSSR
jgi:hypothetical protein